VHIQTKHCNTNKENAKEIFDKQKNDYGKTVKIDIESARLFYYGLYKLLIERQLSWRMKISNIYESESECVNDAFNYIGT